MRIALVIIGLFVFFGVYAASISFAPPPVIGPINAPSIEGILIPLGYLISVIILVLGAALPKKKEVMHVKVVKDDDDVETEQERRDDSVRILRQRYARGEITKEQMNQMREDLEEE